MSPNDLTLFVKEALAQKVPKPRIKEALLKAGWEADEVNAALDSYADVDFPVPVPRRKPYLSARDAFIYLVLFLCLYITAFSFGKLLFDFINHWVPDALQQFGNTDVPGVRMAVSALIIAFLFTSG